MDILLIGDDRRQRCLGELLRQTNRVFAFGQHCRPDAIVLPCPSFDATGALRADCTLAEVLQTATQATAVFCCGGKEHLKSSGLRHIDLLADACVALQNARLTAEAALLAVADARGESLHKKRCLVIGYGRIGAYLARLLAAVGAECTVFARRKESRTLAEGYGFCAAAPGSAELSSFDYVFNTVPAQALTRAELARLPETCTWVELASAPFGLPQGDFAFSVLPAGGLPGKYLPHAAAKVLFDAITLQIGI